MGEWEWSDAKAGSSGSLFMAIVLLSLRNCMLVKVKSQSNCPPNYEIINFLFEVPYLRSSSLVALCDRDLFFLPVSGRKICSSSGI